MRCVGGTGYRSGVTEVQPFRIQDLLPASLLHEIYERAAGVDRENVFPDEDLRALKNTGYLRMLVPTELGGGGATLLRAAQAQMKLAKASPSTALAINMHLITTGIARNFYQRGDHSLDWLLRDAAAGEVFGLAISEPGNDAVTFDSTVTAAAQPDGGYCFTGTKIFTSLAPVWTRLWVFGRDDQHDDPRVVHAVLRREDGGTRSHDDWDTLGMRGTQSHTTSLEGAYAAPERVVGYAPAGPNASPIVFGIFANFLPLIGACYVGMGDRAVELAAEAAHRRHSRVNDAPYADDPGIRELIAQMGTRQLSARLQVESVCRSVDEQDDLGAEWFPRLTLAKYVGTRAARETATDALEVVGGSAYRSGHEMGRLYRDITAGIFQPSQDRGVRAGIANWILDAAAERLTVEDSDSQGGAAQA